MVLESPGSQLQARELEKPSPGAHQILLRVLVCGVCRTDLHIVDGELGAAAVTDIKMPLIPGHQIVGVVERTGEAVTGFQRGQRVGVPWLGWTCGRCVYCRAGQENLCDRARFTGCHIDGGYAEYTVADERYCFPLPDSLEPTQAAPLLCAGLIGYRSYRMTADARRIGFYGFGSAAHLLLQVARWEGRRVYAFTRPGDEQGQEFALRLGAEWAGGSDQMPPEALDAAILFAPVGSLVPAALRAVRKGGVVVCAGIHMSDIPSFPYVDLWSERILRSVANLTRRDGIDLIRLAPRVPIRSEVTLFPLREAAAALDALRGGAVEGSIVIICEDADPAI